MCKLCLCKQKFNLNEEVNYKSNDTENCPILNNKIKRKIKDTDYAIEPIIPPFLGKKIKKDKKDDQISKIQNIIPLVVLK